MYQCLDAERGGQEMVNNTISEEKESDLDLYYNDISSVACHAAIALDNLRLDRKPDLSAVQRLLDIMKSKTALSHRSKQGTFSSSTITTVMFYRAMSNSGYSPSTKNEVFEETLKLEKEFERILASQGTQENIKDIKLDRLRDFCLALSTSSSSSPTLIFSQQPYNSFLC